MQLKEKLSTLRKQRGMTQLELAEELNISRQSISSWERGTADPSTENLVSIGKLFGVSVDNLLDDDLELSNESSLQVTAAGQEANGSAQGSHDHGVIAVIKGAVFSICIILWVAAAIIIISSAALQRPGSDPIPMEDLYGEEIDPANLLHWPDGLTTIDE